MTGADQLRAQYLDAMGIERWLARAAGAPSEPGAAAPAGEVEPLWRPAQRAAAGVAAGPPELESAPQPAPVCRVADPVAVAGWDDLQRAVAACQACPLYRSRTQTVFGVGNPDADWMLIGEAPGEQEDLQGEPFVGPAGQLLDAMLLAVGVTRAEVYIANILKCRPPRNRDPDPAEARRCRPYLERQIALVRPRVLMAVGRVAAQNLLATTQSMRELRGRVHEYRGIPLVVGYHPAYLLRSPSEKRKAWQDLQRVVGLLGARAPG